MEKSIRIGIKIFMGIAAVIMLWFGLLFQVMALESYDTICRILGIIYLITGFVIIVSLFGREKSGKINSIFGLALGIVIITLTVANEVREYETNLARIIVFSLLSTISGVYILSKSQKESNNAKVFYKVILGVGLGIILGFVLPEYRPPIERSREGATKGNLSAIRSSISIYYAEKKGIWPDDLTSNFTSYLYPIPPAKAKPLGNSSTVAIVDTPPSKEGMGWAYNPKTGDVWANSTKKDMKGVPYSSY